MKLKKILLVGIVLIILFSNFCIFAAETNEFYYKGSFTQDTSGVARTTPTYVTSNQDAGVASEVQTLLNVFKFLIVFIMVALIVVYSYVYNKNKSQHMNKDDLKMDIEEEPIKRRD